MRRQREDRLSLEEVMSEAPDSGRPLQGVRVLDLISGDMGAIGRRLAELGADVVRLEPLGGAHDRRAGLQAAGVSLDFVAANLGKRATTLDRLSDLARDADIVLSAAGLDIAPLRAANPRLVVMTVSDFGLLGRFAGWQGSDAVFHALSGELARSGLPGRAPLLPPGRLAKMCAAGQAAYVVLLAYYNALKTGVGDHLDFSLQDGAAQAIDPGYGIGGSAAGGVSAANQPRGRVEARRRYPILRCRDGFVRLCILSPRQWRGLFEWMGRPEAFADPSFERTEVRFRSPALFPALAAFFADKDRRRLEAEGQRFGVPIAAVLDLDEALATEQMTARGAFADVELAAGVSAAFPNGVIEVDGRRLGPTGGPPQVDREARWRGPRIEVAPFPGGGHPLSGLKVLDFGVIVVGAEAGRLLGDQGADVIKVENAAFPDGSRQNRSGGLISVGFASGHRNKRSLGLNLRSPDGQALLRRLVAQSDVLLSNFKGGTLQSLGLDYATLRKINPGIIVTDSSAFGPSGPWSDRMGYGPLVRASAGLTMQWRYDDDPESFSDSITVYPDHVAGRISAIGVLALLIRRLRTGVGGQVSVSQAEVMLDQMGPFIAAHALERSGRAVVREDVRSAVYACAGDDEWCVVTERGFDDAQAISRVTGGAPLAEWLAAQDSRDAMETLQAAGVPAGAMLRVADLPGFDYFVARGFFRTAPHPHLAEPLTVEAAPVRAERLAPPPQRPAPLAGEHTIDILRHELGAPQDEIEQLVRTGAIEPLASQAPTGRVQA
jgi:crotonobetainyl-CoA:carnitine CoA-transferase CaiB-like acyl-CoA transferase